MNPIAISDRQIANVVTYVRQAWGNEADPIEIFEDDVASVREDYYSTSRINGFLSN